VLEEENYTETGSFTHDGTEYDIGKAFSLAKSKKTQPFKVSELSWVLKYDTADPERKKNADLNAPIMVANDEKGRLTVVDGLHRLARAVEEGVAILYGVFFDEKDLLSLKKQTKTYKIKIKSTMDEKKKRKKKKKKTKKKKKWGVYGGQYYDFSFLDSSDGDGDGGGGE
jgi:predicted transport protein